MLKHRIITAIILIPLFIALVVLLPPIGFCVFTGLVVLWGAWEWSFFMGINKFPQTLFYPIILFFLMLASLQLPLVKALHVSVAGWMLALILVVLYPKMSPVWGKSIILRGLMGLFVLIPCWLAVNFIRNEDNGIFVLLFLFVLIWGADIGAYFVGRKWGKHKLASLVSPGKTWEGLIGALIVTVIIVLGVLFTQNLPYSIWPVAILLSIVTVLSSILGDLFESMLKRNAGLKDSGHLLPGHGGILDRIDSLTAAAPVFSVGAIWIGKFF